MAKFPLNSLEEDCSGDYLDGRGKKDATLLDSSLLL